MSTRLSASEISFVVQGPVERSQTASTHQVCESIRRFFPGAEIVISTWQGADTFGLDADQVVLSQDPGTLTADLNANLNRLLVSSREGVRRATRPLVMKTRSDISFTSNAVLDYWDRWNDFAPDLRLFRKRVLVPNVFTIKHSYFNSHAFKPSDWCFLGLREDIEFLFDVPLCSLEKLLVPTPHDPVLLWRWSEPWAVHQTNEQYLWLSALRKRFPDLSIPMRFHLTPESLRQTEIAFANNLVVLDAATQYGIFAPKYPQTETGPGAYQLLSHRNWQGLYDAYCAASPGDSPLCTLDDLRAAKDDYSDWIEEDPRFTTLRRDGHAWEAMLLGCVLRARRSGMSPCRADLVTDSTQALGLWAEAHLTDCLSPLAAACETSPPARSSLASSVDAPEASCSQTAHNVVIRENTANEQTRAWHTPDFASWQERTAGRFTTVCTRTRPGQPLTKQWLQDLAQQTNPDTRFVVLIAENAGAGNATPAWMPSFLVAHPEFLLVQTLQNVSAAAVWNYCFRTFDSACLIFVSPGDLLKRNGIQELAALMRAYPHVAVGRAALAQSLSSGAKEFHPLCQHTAILSNSDAVTAGLLQGAFTRSPSIQSYRRDLVLQMPALCEVRWTHHALDELALRLAARSGLIWCADSFGLRPPHATASAKEERIARFQEECAIKIHVLREIEREQIMEYNCPFVVDVCRQINMLYLSDYRQAEYEEERTKLKHVYEEAMEELRGVSHDLSIRKHAEAVACYERGETAHALSLFQHLVVEARYFGPAHNDLSVLLHDQQDYKLSLEHSKHAVAIMPDNPDAWRNMAYLLAFNGRQADAAHTYRRLLDLVPDDTLAHEALAALASCAPAANAPSGSSVSAAAA